jgi:hypothetical protein
VSAALYFCHIQKTAGTSVLALLDRYFSAAEICPAQRWQELSALELKTRRGFALYAGHFGAGGLRALTALDPPTITFLREPVALARSTYLHLLRETDHRLVGVLKHSADAVSFINDPRAKALLANRQCASLSFDLERDPCLERFLFSTDALDAALALRAKSPATIDESTRQARAATVLESLAAFGLVERLDESLQLLAWQRGWPDPGDAPRLREAPAHALDLRAFDAAAAAQNQGDAALYANAQRRFNERLAAMRLALKRSEWKLLSPKTWWTSPPLESALDRNFLRLGGAPASAAWDARERWYGRGVHRRERLPDGGAFRWTSERTVRLFLTPNARVSTLELDVIDRASAAQIEQLAALVDGHPAAVLIDGAGPWRIALKLARPIAAGQCVALDLALPPPEPHAHSHPGSRDARRVGLAIRAVRW